MTPTALDGIFLTTQSWQPLNATSQHLSASVRESEINKSQFHPRKAHNFAENIKQVHTKLQYKVKKCLGTQGEIPYSWRCHLENRIEVCGLGGEVCGLGGELSEKADIRNSQEYPIMY